MPPSTTGFVPQNAGPLRAPLLNDDHWPARGVEGVFVCLPKPLAGMGTLRQLQGIAAGLREMTRSRSVETGYVGPAIADADPLLSEPYETVESSRSVPGTFRQVTSAFTAVFGRIAKKRLQRVAILCMGYTAFGPESVKRALEANRRQSGDSGPETVSVLVIDSAYPDTDRQEVALDADGWPTSRFYSPGFCSDGQVKTFFLLTSSYLYDLGLLNARAPEGLAGASVVAPPYTESYLSELTSDGERGRRDGLGAIARQLPGMAHFKESDRLVPLVSSDIWSSSAVDVWMTREEHRSCLQGTESILRALVRTAGRLDRRIWVPIDTAGADFARGLGIADLVVAGSTSAVEPAARVVLSPYRGLSQKDHSRLLGAADVAISRTGGQANSTCVLGLSMTPNVVVDMPAMGYMQSELTSVFMTHDVSVSSSGEVCCQRLQSPLAWRACWDWSKEALADLFETALTDVEERRRRARRAYDAFFELKRLSRGNVFSILDSMIR
jgi:hypothetical protein